MVYCWRAMYTNWGHLTTIYEQLNSKYDLRQQTGRNIQTEGKVQIEYEG